jgi:hypothetical protein
LSLLFGCSDGENSRDFEELLTVIEEGENILEEQKAIYSQAYEDFRDCNGGQLLVSCEYLYLDWRIINMEILRTYKEDLVPIRARLFAIPPSEGNPAITEARNAFIDHIDAWQDSMRKRLERKPSEYLEFLMEVVERGSGTFWISVENNVNETFKTVCKELGNAQPNRNEMFQDRIIDICYD